MVKIFETPRLILRQFNETDAAHLLALNSDPEVLRYLHERPLTDEEDALIILRTIIFPQYQNNLGRWAIHVKDTDEFIGWCGLKYRAEIDETDLGYRLKQSAWGKGYATEAAQHTLEYGFEVLQIPVITGRAHIENLASQKILEKIGMTFVGEEFLDDILHKKYVAAM